MSDLPLDPEMGDESEIEQPEGEQEASIPEYEDLVTEEAELEVSVEEANGMAKGVTESEEEAEMKSDFQAAVRRLFPKYKDEELNDVLQSAMVARTFPENLKDKAYAITLSILEAQEGDPDMDVVGTISKVQDAVGIGYEGRGRIDVIEMAGAAKEEELEKISSQLGLG